MQDYNSTPWANPYTNLQDTSLRGEDHDNVPTGQEAMLLNVVGTSSSTELQQPGSTTTAENVNEITWRYAGEPTEQLEELMLEGQVISFEMLNACYLAEQGILTKELEAKRVFLRAQTTGPELVRGLDQVVDARNALEDFPKTPNALARKALANQISSTEETLRAFSLDVISRFEHHNSDIGAFSRDVFGQLQRQLHLMQMWQKATELEPSKTEDQKYPEL